jgi:AcrR family transcriptional regulator
MASSNSSQNQAGRLYRGQTPQHRKTERREKLLAAALELFGTQGYHEVTIEKICTYSRVTARYFYQEFGNREALMTAVFDRCASQLYSDALKALQAAPENLEDKIRLVTDAVFHSLLDDPRHAQIVVFEVAAGGAPFLDLVLGTKRFFVGLIETEAARLVGMGLLQQRDYNLAASAVYGAGRELLAEWLQRDEKPSIEDLVEEVVSVVLAVAGLGDASG